MRQVVLDTETTGIDPLQGHRIIEIGCVELENRRFTGNTYHQYINPEREVESEAIEVHGITNEFLIDKPKFTDVVEEFIQFISGAELIIHNAPFDVGFLNHEFKLCDNKLGKISGYSAVLDTLVMARKRYPGQRNSLDALCKRLGVDNSKRELHGALLDAEILADVYLLMTGGQIALSLEEGAESAGDEPTQKIVCLPAERPRLKVIKADESEQASHSSQLEKIKQASSVCLWLDRLPNKDTR